MTNLRDKIAEIVQSNCMENKEEGYWDAAYEILAALPGMIPDLVWDGFKSGAYEIIVHEGGIADLFCHAERDEDNEPEFIKGGYLTLVSMDDLKAAANAHHRAKLIKAMGWTI